jgi:hypothetical protein
MCAYVYVGGCECAWVGVVVCVYMCVCEYACMCTCAVQVGGYVKEDVLGGKGVWVWVVRVRWGGGGAERGTMS